ncbi:MAG: SAM-dependent methyltransferase [Elsteraceae bacterium]
MFRFLWRRFIADRFAEMLRHRINVANRVDQARAHGVTVDQLPARIEALEADLAVLRAHVDGFGRRNFFLPDLAVHPQITDHPFMADSSCSAKDFFHPDFARLCAMLDLRPSHHRKIWEYAFILHHLERLQMLGPGKRGLGFGVGAEPLPSLFARQGVTVTATDAPLSVGVDAGWASTEQHAGALDQVHIPSIVDRATFDARVSFQPCDMRAIDPDLTGYDFCWSSCCFEHLGDLRAGLDFVRESVEKTLKIGGVACHTTELNLSSNEDTVESGVTVLYRRRDLQAFAEEMRARGHRVDPIRIAPDSHWLDLHVDWPPYKEKPHLKLEMLGFLTTSIGLVITRGR